MNRQRTNMIRFFMDGCIPLFIRDSYWFMYPFFWFSYNGKHVKKAMNFKRWVYEASTETLQNYYSEIDSISRNRVTDLNQACINKILASINNSDASILEVGCGKGFLIKEIHQKYPSKKLVASDWVNLGMGNGIEFIESDITNLPFTDDTFDVVICTHTLEHIIDPEKAVAELKRVCKKKMIIVVPKQRYFFYTLDEHVNFFPEAENMALLLSCKIDEIQLLDGDWFVNMVVKTLD